jgi:hypothetical protein
MKFEKFLKMTAGHGVIVERKDGEKWLLFDGVLMRIPDGVNIIAALRMDEPQFISDIFEEYANENISSAELTNAILPTPDASASKIIRVFNDSDGGEIGVANKYFGIIEKGNDLVTVYDEEYNPDSPAALLVLRGYGENEEIEGIIFDDEYFGDKINERK